MAGADNDMSGWFLVLKVLGILAVLLGAAHRANMRERLNAIRFERFAAEVETRGELSATTAPGDRAHRALVARLCENPDYRAKLAAVRSLRATMVTLANSHKNAGARVREARVGLQTARGAGAGAAVPAASPAAAGSEAESLAEARQRLGAAAKVAIQCKERLNRAFALRTAATQEARRVRLRIMQQRGDTPMRVARATSAGGQAGGVAVDTADAAAAGGGAAAAATGPADNTITPAAVATIELPQIDTETPVDCHVLEEARRLL